MRPGHCARTAQLAAHLAERRAAARRRAGARIEGVRVVADRGSRAARRAARRRRRPRRALTPSSRQTSRPSASAGPPTSHDGGASTLGTGRCGTKKRTARSAGTALRASRTTSPSFCKRGGRIGTSISIPSPACARFLIPVSASIKALRASRDAVVHRRQLREQRHQRGVGAEAHEAGRGLGVLAPDGVGAQHDLVVALARGRDQRWRRPSGCARWRRAATRRVPPPCRARATSSCGDGEAAQSHTAQRRSHQPPACRRAERCGRRAGETPGALLVTAMRSGRRCRVERRRTSSSYLSTAIGRRAGRRSRPARAMLPRRSSPPRPPSRAARAAGSRRGTA